MLVFVEGGNSENSDKNPRSKGENQQQTQPTDDAGPGNRTLGTLVGGQSALTTASSLLLYTSAADGHYNQLTFSLLRVVSKAIYYVRKKSTRYKIVNAIFGLIFTCEREFPFGVCL